MSFIIKASSWICLGLITPLPACAGIWDLHLLHLQKNIQKYDTEFQKKVFPIALAMAQQCKMPIESIDSSFNSITKTTVLSTNCDIIREEGFTSHCSNVYPASIMDIPFFKTWNLGFNEQYYQTLQFRDSKIAQLSFQCYVNDVPFQYRGATKLTWSKEQPLTVNTSNGAITAKTKNITVKAAIPYYNGRPFSFNILGVAPYQGNDSINLH